MSELEETGNSTSAGFEYIPHPGIYKISQYLLRATTGGVHVHGAENIPDKPAVYLVSHRSLFDIPAAGVGLYKAKKQPANFVAKDDLWNREIYNIPGLDRWLDAVGALEVTRGKATRKQTNTMVETAKAGNNIVVFGEGTRGKGPEIGPIEQGVLYVAAKAEMPIVFVGVAGTKPFRYHKIHDVFGEGIEADHVAELYRDRKKGSMEIVRYFLQEAFSEANDYLEP